MPTQPDALPKRSNSELDFQRFYPLRFVTSLAAQLMGTSLNFSDDEAFVNAAKCACKLIDTCHEVALRHYTEEHGVRPWINDDSREPFKKAVEEITGNKKRPKDALEDFKKYFFTLTGLFHDLNDSLPPEDPGSPTQASMHAALAAFESDGVPSNILRRMKEGYPKWKTQSILEARKVAGAKGAAKTPRKKPSSKSTTTGKFKKKEKFFLTPKEEKLLDGKMQKLSGKDIKK